MHELDDIALLREYVEHGSEDAFAMLVARHINKVYSVALRHTGNQHQAEEIAQAVFLILARKSRSLGKRVILEGWLYQTARLTALSSVRSEIRRTHREQEAYMQSVSNDEPQAWSHIAPVLDAAITSLNKMDRDALMLRYFYGENMKEIAARLRLSEGATRLRLHRTMEKLRRFFDKRGIVSTSEIIAGAISAHAVAIAPAGLAKTATALALAKAPAAFFSILTLINGALKTMAWTNAKSACVAGLIVLLAAGTTPIVIKEIRSYLGAHPIQRTTAATGSIKGQFFGPGQLVDAGNTTPEAAWESRYWARAQGDYDAVIAATDPKATGTDWLGDKATFGARSRKSFATEFQGFQILGRKDLSNDRVELKYRFTFQDGQDASTSQPTTKIVTMAKAHGVWRCAQTRAHDASWDVGSQQEPES